MKRNWKESRNERTFQEMKGTGLREYQRHVFMGGKCLDPNIAAVLGQVVDRVHRENEVSLCRVAVHVFAQQHCVDLVRDVRDGGHGPVLSCGHGDQPGAGMLEAGKSGRFQRAGEKGQGHGQSSGSLRAQGFADQAEMPKNV